MTTAAPESAIAAAILDRMVAKAAELGFAGTAAAAVRGPDGRIHLLAADCGKMFSADCDYLALACSKIAEMVDTGLDSGAKSRPVLRGEFGYTGGAVKMAGGRSHFAAFSGAKGEEDLLVARFGLAGV